MDDLGIRLIWRVREKEKGGKERGKNNKEKNARS